MAGLGPIPVSTSTIIVSQIFIPSVLNIITPEAENNIENNNIYYIGDNSDESLVQVDMRNSDFQFDDSLKLIINEIDNFMIPSGPEIVSSVFDIFIVDVYGVQNNFNGQAEICLDINSSNEVSLKRSCLGYFNENTQEWECEDNCLEKNDKGQFCGNTSHFTAFSILFYGLDGPGAACASSPNPYIFEEYWQDLILIACFIGASIFCFCIVVICSRFMLCKRIILGKEGYRIAGLRVGRDVKPVL